MNRINQTDSLNRIAEQAVPDNLDLWPQIRAQLRTAAAPPSRAVFSKSSLLRVVIGITAAVLLALVIGATSPLWNAPEAVSAQTILERAESFAESAAAVRTYHLKMTRQVPAKGNATINTEIWFGGRERQRRNEEVKDANGVTVSSSEVVFKGSQAWIANTERGQTQVVHTTGTTWTEPADDPSRQNSLTDVLTKYTSLKDCVNVRLEREASLGGQAAYLIVVTPGQGGCAPKPSNPTADAKVHAVDATKSAAARSTGQGDSDNQVGETLVWVDKLSFLPLKTEVRSASGAVLDQSMVISVEYNVVIPASVFTYRIPSGASVFNFTGGTGADVKGALCATDPSHKCQVLPPPSKKP